MGTAASKLTLLIDVQGQQTQLLGQIAEQLSGIKQRAEGVATSMGRVGEMSFRTQQRVQNSVLAIAGFQSPITQVIDKFEYLNMVADRFGMSVGQMFSRFGAGIAVVAGASVVINKALGLSREADEAWKAAGAGPQGFLKNWAIGAGLTGGPKIDVTLNYVEMGQRIAEANLKRLKDLADALGHSPDAFERTAAWYSPQQAAINERRNRLQRGTNQIADIRSALQAAENPSLMESPIVEATRAAMAAGVSSKGSFEEVIDRVKVKLRELRDAENETMKVIDADEQKLIDASKERLKQEFYANEERKAMLAEEAGDAEKAASIRATLAEARKAKVLPSQDDYQILEARQARLDKINADLVKQDTEMLTEKREVAEAESKIRKDAADQAQKIAEADMDLQVRIAEQTGATVLAIELKSQQERLKLRESLGRDLTAAESAQLDRLKALALAQDSFNRSMQQAQQIESDYATRLAAIESQQKSGSLSERGAMRAQIDLQARTRGQIQSAISSAESSGPLSPEELAQVDRLKQRLESLNPTLSQLASASNSWTVGFKFGLQQMADQLQTVAQVVGNTMATMSKGIADAAGGAFRAWITGSEDAGAAFARMMGEMLVNIATAIVTAIAQALIIFAVLTLLDAIFPGLGHWFAAVLGATATTSQAMGGGGGLGAMAGMQDGGFVTGPSGTDAVPTRLTAGEAVIPLRSVARYGADFISSIIDGSLLAQPMTPAYAYAGGAGGDPNVNVGAPAVHVVFVRDHGSARRYLESSVGRGHIARIVRDRGTDMGLPG